MEFELNELIQKWKNKDEFKIRQNVQQLLNCLTQKPNHDHHRFSLELKDHVDETLKLLIEIVDHNQNPEVLILSCTCISYLVYYSHHTVYHYLCMMLDDNLDTNLVNKNDDESSLKQALLKIVENTDRPDKFRLCAFLGGLLNNRFVVSQIINLNCDHFFLIHSLLIKLSHLKLDHTFHVFRILLSWFRSLKTHQNKLFSQFKPSFDESDQIKSTLKTLDSNWKSSFSGVNDCVKAIYKLLIELHLEYCHHFQIESDVFLISQVQDALQRPWDWNGKYRKLSILIPFIGWQTILKREPKLPSLLIKYLSINNLASAITECYKCLISSMSKSQDGQEAWSRFFLDLIIEAMSSNKSVVYENTIAHLLPCTLVNIINSYQLLSQKLNAIDSQIVLIRVALKHQVDLKVEKKEQIVQTSLHSQQDSVRLESFFFLLDSKLIKSQDILMSHIKNFLSHNLNIDSPLFRQKLIFKLTDYFQKWLRPSNRRPNFDLKAFRQDFILIQQFLFANLIPGANFQRRTTSLLLLESFFKLNKELDIDMPISKECANTLLFSIMDRDDTIREVASKLLASIINCKPEIFKLNEPALVAINLINCPKHQEAQSGALLLSSLVSINDHQLCIQRKKIRGEMDLLYYLLSTLEQKKCIIETQNVLKASYEHPLHGYLLCINYILSSPVSFQRLINCHFQPLSNFVNQLVQFTSKLIQSMLELLSLNSNNFQTSPSFKEMSIALNQFMDDEESISLSPQFQCLLTYYWLNIKESCSLLANLAHLQSICENEFITKDTLIVIGRLIITALMRCRHKGAIEACCLSLGLFAQSTLAIKFEKEVTIPQTLLLETISQLKDSVKHSSTTRRSAGFGMIIKGILVGEAKYLKANSSQITGNIKSSFHIAVEKLISFINLDLNQANSSTDNIQSVSIHILRSLIISTALSSLSLNICERLILICIEGLSSPIWSIRNASLQLFGACCSRIMGQRNVIDSEGQAISGTLTFSNLLFKYPSLESMINSCLTESIDKQSSNNFPSSLVPLLSFISNLSPCGFESTYSQEISSKVFILLKSSFWKVRSLASRCLLSVANIHQLKFELLQNLESSNLASNQVHGIIMTIHNLWLLREEFQLEDTFFQLFESKFRNWTQVNSILTKEYEKVFRNSNMVTLSDSENEIKINLNSIYRLTDPLSSLSQRLSVITFLNLNVQNLHSTIDHNLDLKVQFYFFLLNLLHDEESEVRKVTSSFIQTWLSLSFTPSFNIASQLLLQNLAQVKSDQLIQLVWRQLEAYPSIMNHDFENESKLIIFEEENRNLFLEQFFLFAQLFHLITALIEHDNQNLHLTQSSLDQICKDILIISQHDLSISSLMQLSNGKISKLFTKLFNLLIRIRLISSYCLQKDQFLAQIESKAEEIFKMVDNYLTFDKLFRTTDQFLSHINGNQLS